MHNLSLVQRPNILDKTMNLFDFQNYYSEY